MRLQIHYIVLFQDMTKVLYNFEKDEYGHPFTRRNGVGDFGPQEFYNFQLGDLKKINLAAFGFPRHRGWP